MVCFKYHRVCQVARTGRDIISFSRSGWRETALRTTFEIVIPIFYLCGFMMLVLSDNIQISQDKVQIMPVKYILQLQSNQLQNHTGVSEK